MHKYEIFNKMLMLKRDNLHTSKPVVKRESTSRRQPVDEDLMFQMDDFEEEEIFEKVLKDNYLEIIKDYIDKKNIDVNGIFNGNMYIIHLLEESNISVDKKIQLFDLLVESGFTLNNHTAKTVLKSLMANLHKQTFKNGVYSNIN